MSEKYVVQPMRAGDLVPAARLAAACFSNPWRIDAFADALIRKDTVCLSVLSGEALCGYAVLYTALDEGELVNIAVAEEHRKRGVGGMLLDEVLAAGEALGVKHFYLEVRESNLAAQGLYRSRGFQTDGVRRDFYEKPRENAFVMSLHPEITA